jgi:hypothetical protein
VHAALPLVFLYLPATHKLHPPPSGPAKPIRQRQALLAELEVGELEFPGQDKQTDDRFAPIDVEYMFAGHSSHGALPLAFLYLPAVHRTQTVPSPCEPALQVQFVIDTDPTVEYAPAGQFTHRLPTKYCPGAQVTL